VTLSLHHRGSVDISPAHLGGTFSYVMDYLVTEVLDNQPSAMQDALIRTAILDRFSAPLCEAVCQGKAQASGSSEGTVDDDAGDVELSGQAFVAWLLENNPFLVRLDDSGEWYRYHHLLRELLQSRLEQRLGAEGVAALHRRASAWFAQNQLIDEALHHALAAGEPEAAANMVAQHRHALIDREQWQRLERWLLLFDQAKIERHAELSIIEAWLHNLHGRWQEESAVLARVENLLASTTVPSERALSVQGEIHLMRANLLGWTYNGPAVLRHTEIALELLPRQWRYAYTSAYMVDCYGHLLCGYIDLARKQLQHGLADPRIASQPQYKTMLLFGMAGLLWASLNLREMRVFSRQYLAHGKEFNLQEAIAVASCFLGCVHYLQNDLVAAQKHFSDAVETRYLVNLSWQTQAVCGLAITYYALDRIEQAMDVLDEFQAKLIERDNYILLNVIKGCRAELALREGNLAEAKHWAESYDPQPLIGLQGFYIPQLTLAKIWLAQDPPASNENGANLLGQLMAIAQSAHLTSALLPVLLVQSLLDEQVGDEATALNHLADAIHLAEPNGIIRAFVDIGSRMANLLVRLGQHGVAQDHIAQIIEAFPIQHAVVSSGHQGALIEPLTDRELEVLTLLAQRKRNQDIADELVITVGTVKQYTHKIYQKLGVKDRHAAVAKAVSLGILTLEP
jgi:LuxR family maltose regulon positive regulatory protein